MLTQLSIRNILLLKGCDIPFGAGLNALTGETGAGKSILLDALGFVLGWRGRADIVRAGAAQGEVVNGWGQFGSGCGVHPAVW
jgi:DNA repair protein RecN (Recombination protein N)